MSRAHPTRQFRRLNLLAAPGLLVLMLWASAGTAAAHHPSASGANRQASSQKSQKAQPIGYDISYP
ncbi:MAG TPA: hypothetical protein VES36_09385, partial [Candidatus Limnocylindrales bacterium]|nr:hypothetical protein [Candidatus Limnocylindrales bacterium]